MYIIKLQMCVLTPIALKEVDSILPPAYNDDLPPPLPATAVDVRFYSHRLHHCTELVLYTGPPQACTYINYVLYIPTGLLGQTTRDFHMYNHI